MRCFVLPAMLYFVQTCQPAFGQTAALTDGGAVTSFLSGWTPYIELQYREAYDAIPVKKFESDWSEGFSPRNGRNVLLQRNRVAIGMEKGAWSIGWELRQETTLVTNRQTLELIHLYKQRVDPAASTAYDFQARFNGWSAQGLRVARWFDGPTIAGMAPRLNLSAALYTKPRLREGEVSGSVTYAQGGAYTFNARQTDANNRSHYLFMQHNPSASGASVSVAMDLPLTEALSVKLKIDDLWSRMKWRNLPVTQRNINSDVTEYDSEGYINYRPLLSGFNRQVTTTVTIPRTRTAALSYRSGAWEGTTQIERLAGVTVPAFSLTRHFDWGRMTASAETRFKTIGLGIERGNFRFSVQSDSLQLKQAKALGLHISYRMAFDARGIR